MTLREEYEQKIDWLRQYDHAYQTEELVLGICEAIAQRMEQQNITKADLARRLQVSPAHISQLLDADSTNFTLKTLAKIATALQVRLAWDFEPLLQAEDLPAGDSPRWECQDQPACTVNKVAAKEPGEYALLLAA